jgi:hypothetical protein
LDCVKESAVLDGFQKLVGGLYATANKASGA